VTIHKNINFAKGHITKLSSMSIENGDTFEQCNFTQVDPHTDILVGYTGLTFKSCNLMNCVLPVGATKDGCLHLHRSFCTHLHPTKVGTSGVCAENCSHVTSTDEVIIDSQAVATIYHYTDTEGV